MSKIQIKTTQNILLAFEPASIGERMGAFAIDFVLIMGYGYLVNAIMKLFYYNYQQSLGVFCDLFGTDAACGLLSLGSGIPYARTDCG